AGRGAAAPAGGRRAGAAQSSGWIASGTTRGVGQRPGAAPRGTSDRAPGPERAILVGLLQARPSGTRHSPRDSQGSDLEELSRLAETAGAVVAGRVFQKRPKPDPRSFIGAGKVEDLKEDIYEHSADLVILDGELTPAQQRNLERLLEVKVIDRTALVLDI